MPAYLDAIIAAHRAAAASDMRDLDTELEKACEGPPTRLFIAAIQAAARDSRMAVISEIKRRSPSKGDIALSLDPARVASEYEAGGAACLSVLTDRQFFNGSPDDLQVARAACSLPVLRKDFTVSALDVCDARAMGADGVLLIVAALTDSELVSYLATARVCSLSALVEVHDEEELDRALEAGADLIGVNQRNLHTFEVDRTSAERLGALIPQGSLAVAESGIRNSDDVRRMADAGFDAVLVGESLVRSADRRAAVADLLECPA